MDVGEWGLIANPIKPRFMIGVFIFRKVVKDESFDIKFEDIRDERTEEKNYAKQTVFHRKLEKKGS